VHNTTIHTATIKLQKGKTDHTIADKAGNKKLTRLKNKIKPETGNSKK
jgi:hypothetical protein